MKNISRTIEGILYPNESYWFPKRKVTKNIGDENRNYLFKAIYKILRYPESKRMFDELWNVSSEILISSGEIQSFFPFRKYINNRSDKGREIYVAKHGSLMGSKMSVSFLNKNHGNHISLVKLFNITAYTGIQKTDEYQKQYFHNKFLENLFNQFYKKV